MTSSPGVLRTGFGHLRAGKPQHAEGVLGAARVALAISALIAFTIYPVGSSQHAGLASALLFGYALYAVLLLVAIWFRPVGGQIIPWILALDAGWMVAITFATGGPGNPFLVLVAITLLAVVGYLVAREREVREAAVAVARIAEHLRPADGPRPALEGALRELLAVFGARTVLLVARDESQGRIYQAHAGPVGPVGPLDAQTAIVETELGPEEESTYLFKAPAECWYAVAPADLDRPFEARALPRDEHRPRKATVRLTARLLAAHPFRSLLVLSAPGPGRWCHRLLLFDARVGTRELRVLQMVARQIAPAIYSVELLGRLRSRVGAAERARVARDLHDGVIQALIGLEMQVHVWRTEADSDSATASKLDFIQQALRKEVLDLRDLIQQMKTVSVNPKHVLEHLASLVERFQRDSGIEGHFVSEIAEIDLSPQVCDEVLRIVQEALVNVRKHSGAHHVLVRVSAPAGFWKFEVDDDGRGFEFAGRRSQADLDLARKGPVAIKERVRSIGGHVAVESDPGQGARVEIWLPRHTHG